MVVHWVCCGERCPWPCTLFILPTILPFPAKVKMYEARGCIPGSLHKWWSFVVGVRAWAVGVQGQGSVGDGLCAQGQDRKVMHPAT